MLKKQRKVIKAKKKCKKNDKGVFKKGGKTFLIYKQSKEVSCKS
jgi:hypothetical protein